MAGSSALLKSAASRRAAIQNEQNRIADMEWNLSAKTADDLALYQQHYGKASERAGSSEKITISSKLISATRAYRSKEIQRSSIGVLEGTMDNRSKQNMMVGLYNSALDNGDYNSAQSLRNQIDTLQNTIIAEDTATMNTAQKMADAGYKTIKAYVTDLKNGSAKILDGGPQGPLSMNDINDMYTSKGPAGMKPFLEQFSLAAGIPTASFIDIANYYAQTMMKELETSANNLIGEDRANVVNDIVSYNNGDKKISIPGMSGNDKGITLSDLTRAVESQTNGTSPIIASQNSNNGSPGFVPAKIQSWAITTDANGISKPTVIYRQQLEGETATPSEMLTNFSPTNSSGDIGVKITKPDGSPYTAQKLFKSANGDIVDVNGKVVIKLQDVPTLESQGVVISGADKIAAKNALADRGFTVYEGGTVDLPKNAEVPDMYKNLTASSYNIDTNGLVQFAYENPTGDPKNPVQRSVLIYDPKTNMYTSNLEKGLYTINNQTYNRMGELVGSGSTKQNINPLPPRTPLETGTSAYDEAYAKQRQITPSLPVDPNKGSYTIGGVTYNAAGDVINKVTPIQTPIVPYVAPATKPATSIVQPSNIGKMAQSAITKPPIATTPISAPKSLVLKNVTF